jgi:hypothetical protein
MAGRKYILRKSGALKETDSATGKIITAITSAEKQMAKIAYYYGRGIDPAAPILIPINISRHKNDIAHLDQNI